MKMSKKTKKIVGNLLIVSGFLLIFCFLWVNCSGRVYQQLYSLWYENIAVGDDDDFISYDQLPIALKTGQSFVITDADPGLMRAEVTVNKTEATENEEATESMEASAATEATESTEPKKAKEKKPTPVFDTIKEIGYTERSLYESYDMGLIVKRMGVKSRVIGGTSLAELKKAPGLYETSALPDEEKGNVIIAAHRDVYGAWFYNIDKVRAGDEMKIYFGDKIYVYEYKDTNIVEKNDWSLLKEEEEPMLILTSCHPKGTSEKRIIVRAVLKEIIRR